MGSCVRCCLPPALLWHQQPFGDSRAVAGSLGMAAPIVALVAAWEADAPVLEDPHPKCWQLDQPHLYRLDLSIVPGAHWAAV